MPNLIPDWLPWMRPAGRFILAVILLALGLAIVGALMRRPKRAGGATWAECMAGAVGVFALMTLAYAVVPHEWITFSDKYLQWDTTKFVFRSNQKFLFFNFNWPFNMDKKAIRDIIVTGIYVVLFGMNLALFAMWQKRGAATTDAGSAKARVSRFGRPLRRRTATPTTVAAGVSGGDA